MSTTQNKKNKTKEAKLIANCFNAIANTLTDKAKPAEQVMQDIHEVTEHNVKLFAKTNDNVKYGEENEKQATAADLEEIETAIGHEILRGYLKRQRLDVSKVQKSKFYKDVQQAITAAGKSLTSAGTSGNLSQAQTEALTTVKHKASNAAEFLATLFQIVQEYYETNQRAALSVIVGLIANLNESKPVVVAKGRTGHKTVLAEQDVKNAVDTLKANWKKYREMDTVTKIDLSKPKPKPQDPKPAPQDTEGPKEQTDLSEIQTELKEIKEGMNNLNALKLANLETDDLKDAAKGLKKISEEKIDITAEKEYMTVKELKEVMSDEGFDKELNALEAAAGKYNSSQSTDNFKALDAARIKKIKNCSLSRIIKSLYKLTLTEKGRIEVLATLILGTELTVTRITKIHDALTRIEAQKEKMTQGKTEMMNANIVKLTNRVILCDYLDKTTITIEYSAEKEYEEELKEKLKAIQVDTIKAAESGFEIEQKNLADLMEDKVDNKIDKERTQSYAKKNLVKITGQNKAAGDLIEKMVTEDKNSVGVRPAVVKTVTETNEVIKKEDWDYSKKIDDDQNTKEYAVPAERSNEITLTNVPGESKLHGLVHEKGVKLESADIKTLINKYQEKTEKYLGKSTLPAHAKEGQVAQAAEKAEAIILDELQGLTDEHLKQEKGDKLYVGGESGLAAEQAAKVFKYKDVIETLVKANAIKSDLLKNVAALNTGDNQYKLVVATDGITKLEEELEKTKKVETKPQPEKTPKKEEKKEENGEKKEEVKEEPRN